MPACSLDNSLTKLRRVTITAIPTRISNTTFRSPAFTFPLHRTSGISLSNRQCADARILVEAAGVEPASENVTGQENYMLSRVHAPGITLRRSRPTLRTDKKRVPLACGLSLSFPDVEEKSSPLCDVLRRPTGEASWDGCLN